MPLVYLNQIGGQGEAVFDGASFVLNADASLAGQLPAFRESVALTVWEKDEDGWRCAQAPRAIAEEGDEADYAACVLGLRDYVDKTGAPGVALALSGDLDSALCAAMAVDALGPARVRAIALPADRSASAEALAGAAACAQDLGVRFDVVPVAEALGGLEACLKPMFQGRARDAADEHIQTRIRGAVLLSVANTFGLMPVASCNKSDRAIGSATLSDGMSGYNPIKDCCTTEVDRLAALRNLWKPARALGAGRPGHLRNLSHGIGLRTARELDGPGLPPAWRTRWTIFCGASSSGICACPTSSRAGMTLSWVSLVASRLGV